MKLSFIYLILIECAFALAACQSPTINSSESIVKEPPPSGDTVGYYEKKIFANGTLKSSIHYKKGVRNGVSEGWYENGQKASREIYQNGNLKSFSYWLPNGKRSGEGVVNKISITTQIEPESKDSVFISNLWGPIKYWNAKGVLEYQISPKDSSIFETTRWDSTGKIISQKVDTIN
jgi:antitoxin component YwqK of YwqJK toxin-antitoxin module